MQSGSAPKLGQRSCPVISLWKELCRRRAFALWDKCISWNVCFWNYLSGYDYKIIKRKHSPFPPPQVSKNSFHGRNHLASRSACFRDVWLSLLQVFQELLSWKHLRSEGNDASRFWAPALCKGLCQPHPGTLMCGAQHPSKVGGVVALCSARL